MLENNELIQLAIVDDHPVVIEGLQRLLGSKDYLNVAGTFTSGADFLVFMKDNRTDIVLLDISLPDTNGMELCKEIKKRSPGTCVLVLSNHSERSIIMQMLQNGASGYLLKNASADELLNCIHEALAGQITFSNEIKQIIARPSAHELKEVPQLTRREKEILHLISDGMTTPQIAGKLNLSQLTIETHRRNLLQKFDVNNVAALIKVAVQQNLI
ncbi:MAG: response regulator transcription factor [Chitinophagaceae bacterium]|nr:response regulator transcription factor [Chitinophagaceae bacterium]